MTLMRHLWLAVLFSIGAINSAAAHETTRSYVTIARDGRDITMLTRVAFRDVEVAVWIDEDLDGRITWGETKRRIAALSAYVGAALTLTAGGDCTLTEAGFGVSSEAGIDYLDLRYAGKCPDATTTLQIESRLFADIDPDHRVFLSATVNGATTTTLLSADANRADFGTANAGTKGSFATYFVEGVRHLLGGADHLVFLLVLMLPAVCGASRPGKAALGVVTAVTGFTVAHALTLTAATTAVLRPPTAVIEVLIALSIVVTAADNVRPFLPAPRAVVSAFFGLIHGFGFATALSALNLTGGDLAVALIGFNLGIEAAQLGVVLVTMPALFMLGQGRVVLWLGSASAAAIGVWWLWLRLGLWMG